MQFGLYNKIGVALVLLTFVVIKQEMTSNIKTFKVDDLTYPSI